MPSSAKVILLFLDGVGLGDDDPRTNPFARFAMPFVSELLDGRTWLAGHAPFSNNIATLHGLDACLGVPGLPQSGTGQGTILSGRNLAQTLGGHDGPYPSAALKAELQKHNLFRQLQARGRRVAYANAYPPPFHARLQRGTARVSANTYAAVEADLPLRTLDDLAAGQALSGDLTNEHWQRSRPDVPLLTPEAAGRQLVAIANDYDLTFFEFWFTDVVGHRGDWGQAEALLARLDALLRGAVAALPSHALLLAISDHGNLEHLPGKQHTPNPALCLAVGRGHQQVQRLSGLDALAPFVGRCLGVAM